jgi:medium-chain acyl-[acyl-carrier-protein] hydrolase
MTNYIVRFQEKEAATARLFCFPYAGATAAAYRPWNAMMPPNIELVVVELPGRLHLRDKPPEDMKAIVDTIYPQILPFLDKPFAIFGHSFGSIVSYEVTKRLQTENKKLPTKLFVSARRAPHLPSRFRQASGLPDQEFIDEMQNMYQAIPEAVLKEKELLKMLLPILKVDIRINETYIGKLDPLLNVPLQVYYGTKDNTITPDEMEQWKAVTQKDFQIKSFEGGHFYIDKEKGTIITEITKNLSFGFFRPLG